MKRQNRRFFYQPPLVEGDVALFLLKDGFGSLLDVFRLEVGLVGVMEEKKLKMGMLVNGGQVFGDGVRFVVTLLEGFDDSDIETRWFQVKVPIGLVGVAREIEA